MNVIEIIGVLYFLMCINCSLAEWAIHPQNGMRYYFSAEAKDCNTASDICKRNYGNLATVHTNLEHEFILRHLNQSADKKFWIGLQIDGSEDIYEWIDGTKIGFSKLIYDKSLEGSCVAYEWDILLKKWKWKTSECFEDNHFICKLSSGPCPAVSISGAMLYKEMNGVYEFNHERCDCCEDQLRPVYKKPDNGLLLYFNVVHNGWCITSTCVKNKAIRFSNSIYPYVVSASMSYELSQSNQNWAPSFFVIKCLADYKSRYDKLPPARPKTTLSTTISTSPAKFTQRPLLDNRTPNPNMGNGIVMNDSRYRTMFKTPEIVSTPSSHSLNSTNVSLNNYTSNGITHSSKHTSNIEDLNRTEYTNYGQNLQNIDGANCVCGEQEYLRLVGLGFGCGVVFVVAIDIIILVIYIWFWRRRRNKKKQIERKPDENGVEMKTYIKVNTDENGSLNLEHILQ